MNPARVAAALRLLADAIEDEDEEPCAKCEEHARISEEASLRAREILARYSVPNSAGVDVAPRTGLASVTDKIAALSAALSGPRRSPPSLVYFLQGVDGGPIKIGTTRGLAGRVAYLQTASPVRLRVLCAVEGDRFIEQGLHESFAHLRLHGEWFSPGPEILACIAHNVALAKRKTEP